MASTFCRSYGLICCCLKKSRTLLLKGRGRSTSLRNVVTVSSFSLWALRTLSSLEMTDAIRPTTKEKKKPLPIMVTIAQTFSATVMLLMSP